MALTKNVNGVNVAMSAQEEADHKAFVETEQAERQAKADADAQTATDKANAKAKLIAGEALTQAEADTIVI